VNDPARAPGRDDGGAQDITGYLRAVRDGGRAEMDALFGVVYDQLRRLARQRVRRRPGDSLDATTIVHEAYLRLVGGPTPDWRDRQHFFAAAGRAMRHIAVDRARRRQALKRGAGAVAAELQEDDGHVDDRLGDVMAIDEALSKIAEVDPRLVQIVELCFFAGMTTDEAGEALGVSGRTVKREWRKARVLLQALLGAPAG
jgi:RNA polymerase sigma factor (TIGR02999 family)